MHRRTHQIVHTNPTNPYIVFEKIEIMQAASGGASSGGSGGGGIGGPDPAVMAAIERGNAVVFLDVALGEGDNMSPLGRIKLELFVQDVRTHVGLYHYYQQQQQDTRICMSTSVNSICCVWLHLCVAPLCY